MLLSPDWETIPGDPPRVQFVSAAVNDAQARWRRHCLSPASGPSGDRLPRILGPVAADVMDSSAPSLPSPTSECKPLQFVFGG